MAQQVTTNLPPIPRALIFTAVGAFCLVVAFVVMVTVR